VTTRRLTADELSDLLDIDRRTIQRWIGRGCPCDRPGRGKPNLFDEAEVVSWMEANNLTGKIGAPVSDTLEAAKLRKELALAEKYELQTAKEKGLLIERAAVEKSIADALAVFRNRLLGLPASLAPVLAGREVPEIESMLDERLRDFLTDLSKLSV
jgi:phage terminase Nu1 subunit (DNA packaging protein)